jgi:hypothetical protein
VNYELEARKTNKYQQSRHDVLAAREFGRTGYRVELRGGKWAVISRRTNARIISFAKKNAAQKWIDAKLADQPRAPRRSDT